MPPKTAEEQAQLRDTKPAVIAKLSCPDCGAPMRLKVGRFGRFYGCSTWKKTGCRGAVSAHEDGTPLGPAVPTGSAAKERRRKMMRRKNPPTRWERLREESELDLKTFYDMTNEEFEEFRQFGWPEGD